MKVIKVLQQIGNKPVAFIGEWHNVKAYATVAGDCIYDVYTFPITGGPDLQVSETDLI